MEKDLYLYIAGFLIGIRFHQTEHPFIIENNFKKRIQMEFNGFLIADLVKKVDYWIDLKFQNEFEVLVKTGKKYTYINFFIDTSNRRVLTFYHISSDQFKIIIRDILQKLLAKNQGLIFHASASLINGKACLFLGKSGAGKSTITGLISKKLVPLADDNVIIRKIGREFYFYQTPFLEKNMDILKKPEPVQLGSIYILRKSRTENSKSKINNSEKLVKILLKQFLTEQRNLTRQMSTLFKLASSGPNFYLIRFTLLDNIKLIRILTDG